jgi:hypothetical protein
LQGLVALFVQRPIWNRPAICAIFPGVGANEFDIMLPRLAYMFRNGARFSHAGACLIWRPVPLH